MKHCGLLGEKLSHSFSPQIHSVYGDYEYKLYPVEPNELGSFLLKKNFDGLNVTIPYKQTVIPYCSSLSETAARLNSVNTITVNQDGTLHGDNTDYNGFSYMLEKANISVKNKKVLVLGSGGASHTVCAVCKDKGASEVLVVSRSGKLNYGNLNLHSDAQVIVNATPVGMYPNNGTSPVNLSIFSKLESAADLIYNPLKTAFLLQAEKIGINYVNGLSMLAAQAKYSSEMFTGIHLENNLIEKAVNIVKRKMQNIVLIGMPGCGKSSIGKRLAQKLGRRFLDTDEIVFSNTGRTASEIIKADGEIKFRKAEKTAVKEAGKTTASVIATGGGIVLDEKNMDSLKQNGTIFFLKRSINNLATANRPLSADKNALQKLYKTRLPLYNKYADFIIDNNGNFVKTVDLLLNI